MKFLLFIVLALSFHAYSSVEQAKKEYIRLMEKKIILLPHNGSYVLPFNYSHRPYNDIYGKLITQNEIQERGKFNRNLETEFQLSFAVVTAENVFRTDFYLFLAYTHKSFWQLYNDNWSRPFRETNYSPEIFLRKIADSDTRYFGFKLMGLDFGYIHQSNGQIQELSRSWDRVFARSLFVKEKLFLKFLIWYRLPEKDGDDDNPDIADYLGFGELELRKIFESKQSLGLRILPGKRYLSGELSYTYPISKGWSFYTKLAQGRGLSLIDYDRKNSKIGIGVILNDLLTEI